MMRGFYEEFRAHVNRRHPQCLPLVDRFEAQTRREDADLETLLGHLQLVLNLVAGLEVLGAETEDLDSQVDLARELRGYLDAFIVDRCQRFDHERAFGELQSLLELRGHGPLWIFTTNYDLIVEQACEQAGIRLTDGFDAPVGSPVADWNGSFDGDVRLVKLHGSVNWFEDDPGGGLHRLDRGYALPTHEFRLTRNEQTLKPLMIIPTLQKDALGRPYVQLATQLWGALRQIRLLIVAGNSLRDTHIREYIASYHGRLHLLIVDPIASGLKQSFEQPERTHALDIGFSEFLTIEADPFNDLVSHLASTDRTASDDAVAIREFISRAAQDISDETQIRSNTKLHELWDVTRATSMAARAAATLALGDHPHPAVARRLRGILEHDPAAGVRVNAVSALLRVHGKNGIASIGNALERDPSPEVRVEAALALSQLGSSAAMQRLAEVKDSADLPPSVRTVVEDLLRQST